MRICLIVMSCVLVTGCLDLESGADAPELAEEESGLTCTPRVSSVVGAYGGAVITTRKHWLLRYTTCGVDRPSLINFTKPCTAFGGSCGSALNAAAVDWLVTKLGGAQTSWVMHAGVPVQVFRLEGETFVRWSRGVGPSTVLGNSWTPPLVGSYALGETSSSTMPCSISIKCIPTLDEQCPTGPIGPPRSEDFAAWCD